MEAGYIKILNDEGKIPSVEIQLVNNNLWISKYNISRLFNVFNQKIEMNLRSIFKSQLLREQDVSYIYKYVDNEIEKQIVYYNLEVLIFLSYRISSFEAKIFRQFVNSSLREHLQKKKTPETKFVWAYLPMQNSYWLN